MYKRYFWYLILAIRSRIYDQSTTESVFLILGTTEENLRSKCKCYKPCEEYVLQERNQFRKVTEAQHRGPCSVWICYRKRWFSTTGNITGSLFTRKTSTLNFLLLTDQEKPEQRQTHVLCPLPQSNIWPSQTSISLVRQSQSQSVSEQFWAPLMVGENH